MNIVVHIEAPFVSKGDIDSYQLSQTITQKVQELNDKGYEVVAITPITSGSHKHEYDSGTEGTDAGGYGYGYGYSYTKALIITARKV